MSKSIVVLGIAILFAGGCVSPQARRGKVDQVKVGEGFCDFTYIDDDGNGQSFGKFRGDITVLTFSKCDSDQHEPASVYLVGLVYGIEEPGLAEPVGFDMHWSKNGCPEHSGCHLIESKRRLFSLCDADGLVREIYGVTKPDEVVIIRPDGTVALRAPANQKALIEGQLRDLVAERAQYMREHYPKGDQ